MESCPTDAPRGPTCAGIDSDGCWIQWIVRTRPLRGRALWTAAELRRPQLCVNPGGHRLGNSNSRVPTLVTGFRPIDANHSRLSSEAFPDEIRGKLPQLCELRRREVTLEGHVCLGSG